MNDPVERLWASHRCGSALAGDAAEEIQLLRWRIASLEEGTKIIESYRDQLHVRITALMEQINRLLDHCSIPECGECGEIVCPHRDSLHFHHDGCPSCTLIDDDATQAAHARIAELEEALRNAGNVLHAEGVDTGFIDALLAKGEGK